VPSASDKNVTRLIAPDHVLMTADHPMIPNHVAFIEVRRKNCPIAVCPTPDFTHVDGDGEERLIYVLNNEAVKVVTTPVNPTRTINKTIPTDLLHPAGPELTSMVYAVKMADICPTCG